MKGIITILCSITLFAMFSCHNSENLLEGVWIEDYVWPADRSPGVPPNRQMIFNFQKDSVQIKTFFYDLSKEKKSILDFQYSINRDTLIFDSENEIVSFAIEQLTATSLQLKSIENGEKYYVPQKRSFRRLKTYKQSSNETELIKLLTNRVTILNSNNQENQRLGFNEDNTLFELNSLLFYIRKWTTDIYNGELFLITSLDEPIFHIHDVKKTEIAVFQPENSDLNLKLKKINPKYKKIDLLGEWTEVLPKNKTIQPPPPPPENQKIVTFNPNQFLIFSDSTYVSKKYYSEEENIWSFNNTSEIILLGRGINRDEVKFYEKFRLKELTAEKLILERPTLSHRSMYSPLSEIEFERKK